MWGSLPNLVLLVCVSSSPPLELSLFEWRVLRLVALRCSRRQIAVLVNKTVDRVERCQTELKQRTAARTLRELARWARENAACPPGDRLSPLERTRLTSP